jgi:uncharacterized protein YhaN
VPRAQEESAEHISALRQRTQTIRGKYKQELLDERSKAETKLEEVTRQSEAQHDAQMEQVDGLHAKIDELSGLSCMPWTPASCRRSRPGRRMRNV